MKTFLLISMVFAICFAFIVAFYTLWKTNQLKKQSLNSNFTNSYQNAWNNPEFGNLITDFKTKTSSPLSDYELTFIINTLFRNNYQTSSLVNFDSNYEQNNLEKIGKQSINHQNYDFLLVKTNHHFNNSWLEIKSNLDNYLNNLNQAGMICLTDIKSDSNIFKDLKKYCQIHDYRISYEKIGKGLVLIVK